MKSYAQPMWAPLGDGTDDQVRAMIFDGLNIYVAGDFDNVDGSTAAAKIAGYNVLTGFWFPLGQGINDPAGAVVNAMAIHPTTGDIYVGGSFDQAGGADARNIAYWDGASWNTLGTAPDDGIFGVVNALAFDAADNLYVGGTLGQAGDGSGPLANVKEIAMWDGSNWSVLGTHPTDFGVGGSVNSIVVDGNDVIVGGTFVEVGGDVINNNSTMACRVAMFSGGSWSAVGSGVNAGPVNAMVIEPVSGDLFVGGDFSVTGGTLGANCADRTDESTANDIAKWDGSDWAPLVDIFGENGILNSSVRALAVDFLGNVLVGGGFTDAGDCPVVCSDTDRIAAWQTLLNEWVPLDKGFGNNVVNSIVFAPTVSLPKNKTSRIDVSILFAGGSFTQDGNSTSMNRVAQFQQPLPVELVSFDAVVHNRDVQLSWETATETNNAGFEIQHRTGEDASPQAWKTIDWVEGAGTTLEHQIYKYNVTGLELGHHVFRLKQIDYNGTSDYSPEIEVLLEVPGTHTLGAAYPNPFNPQTSFTLAVARDQVVRVDVFDAQGRLVETLFEGELSANVLHPFQIRGDHLAGGLYLYQVTGEAFTESRRVLLVK